MTAVVLPKDLSNVKIALRITGGLGDTLIAVGSTARVISRPDNIIHAAVSSHLMSTCDMLLGVTGAINTTTLNIPAKYSEYDYVIDFTGCFNEKDKLKAKNYYKIISDIIEMPVGPGKFRLSSTHIDEHKIIHLHPGASNPNRRWPRGYWRELAHKLMDSGYYIFWLGVETDYGFNSYGSHKLSDSNPSLSWQVRHMAAHGGVFIGNDSGFCHVAGMLEMPGAVIFSSTSPEDVISDYPKLKPVCKFKELGYIPTRSLAKTDEVSLKCLNAVTPKDIMDVLQIRASACTFREVWPPVRGISVYTSNENLKIDLTELNFIVVDNPFADRDVTIDCNNTKVTLRFSDGRSRRLNSIDPEIISRAIREILRRE